jgi:hypothetical protein
MAHSHYHAVSSARRYGGVAEDYLPLHNFLDSSKASWADQRHRAVLHHAFGVFVAEQVIGQQEEVRLLRAALARVPRWAQRLLGLRIPATTPVTLEVTGGKQVPIRLVAEQHIIEDCGFVPSVEDYLQAVPREKWITRGAMRLSAVLADPDAAPPALAPHG